MNATVTLAPWGSDDLPLLERLRGDPRMTKRLGGAESPDKQRRRRLGRLWTKEWLDEQVYEVRWMVAPEFQARGIAVAATAQAIELVERQDKHRSADCWFAD